MPEPQILQTVFESPTKASVELFTFGSMRVDLVLVNGAWKLTHDGACSSLALNSPGCSINEQMLADNFGNPDGPIIAVATTAVAETIVSSTAPPTTAAALASSTSAVTPSTTGAPRTTTAAPST
jgi:hypothetical protein